MLSEKIQEGNDNDDLVRIYHETIKKVTQNFEDLRFNTGISQMMVFINEAYKTDYVPKSYAEGFVKVLAPIAPHLAEELWSILGHDETISYQPWPAFDEKKLEVNEVEVVIQILGKVRAKMR